MPAFGRDEMLDREQVRNVAAYVYSLTNPDFSTPQNLDRINAGREVFVTTCAACHGENAQGNREVGAAEPDRCLLGLRRKHGHHHRLRPRRPAGPHADMGRAPDARQKFELLRFMSMIWGPGSHDHAPTRTPARRMAPLAARPGGAAAVAGANAHLVYVAFQSQPDCVAHVKDTRRRRRLSRRQVSLLKEKVMGETDKSYWLLSETSGIGETRDPELQRHLPAPGRIALARCGLARLLDPPRLQPCLWCRRFRAFGGFRVDPRSSSGATISCSHRLPAS